MNPKFVIAALPTLIILIGLLIFGWLGSHGDGRRSLIPTPTPDATASLSLPDSPTTVRRLNPYPEAVRVELYAVEKEYVPDQKDRIKQEWVRPLTGAQRTTFESNLTIAYYEKGKAVAACCFPHHFLRYFDANGKLLGEVGICFCCGCVTTEVGSPLRDNEYREFDYAKMKALIEGLGVPTEMGCH